MPRNTTALRQASGRLTNRSTSASTAAGVVACAVVVSAAGCASAPEVQTLATGRPDVSAFAMQGTDLDTLRRAAQRLCPLGGEVVRQSAQGQQPEPADGRWRKAVQATTQWFNPPVQSAELVVVCREPGDRMRLAPLPVAAPAVAAPKPAASAAEFTAALPVGPITPEW